VRALVIVISLLVAPLIVDAQPPGKVARVGLLSAGSERQNEPYLDAFRDGLRELGFVDGRNVAIDARWADGKYDRLPRLAADLVQLKVDAILAWNAPAVAAMSKATSDIPIVMTVLVDPVAAGLVQSLARPGKNLTGLSMISPELVGKQVELLKEVLPRMSRLAVLGNPANPGNAPQVQEAVAAAQRLGLRVQVLEARAPSEIDATFTAMGRERTDAMLVLVDAMLGGQSERIGALATKFHLPSITGIRIHAEAGALLAYGANRLDIHRRAGQYVGNILKGARAAEMPIEQPKTFELIVNLKTARALGVTIPPSLLLRADRVIE